ncbi:MAG: M64 family metallopeptidase [Candidatus Omnitrophota bacterium]|nr:M64 family metallopeptidase [Candidatus Omnitrophota bacterium]
MRRACSLRLSLLGAACWLVWQPSLLAWDSQTLFDNGDSENRIDIVFMGDGYTAAELPTFRNDMNQVIDHLFNETPLSLYAPYFNIHVVDVISQQSGIDHPAQGIYRNTALNLQYDDNEWCAPPNTPTAWSAISDAAGDAPATYNVIMVLVNDSGGACASMGVVGVTSMRQGLSDAVAMAAHEFGHAFGVLADEYWQPGVYTGEEPAEPNVTIQTSRQNIKWNVWIDANTPLPTGGSGEAIGLYEGASGFAQGLFRPTYDSKMRSTHALWKSVNAEQLIKRAYAVVDPIDAHAPKEADGEYRLTTAQTVIFSVDVLRPESPSAPLSVIWLVDGQVVGGGEQFTFVGADYALGEHTLHAFAQDPTTRVKNRPSGIELSGAREWRIALMPNHAPIIYDFGGSVAAGNLLAAAISAIDADGDDLTLSVRPMASRMPLPAGIRFLPLGDVNLDGTLDVTDAGLLTQYMTGLVVFDDVQRALADVDEDGRIQQADADRLLELASGIVPVTRYRFLWKPTLAQVGLYTFRCSVTDGHLTAETILEVEVGVEDVPLLWLRDPDVNDDGMVDLFNDVFALANRFGTDDSVSCGAYTANDPSCYDPKADLNGDSVIDLFNDVFGALIWFGTTNWPPVNSKTNPLFVKVDQQVSLYVTARPSPGRSFSQMTFQRQGGPPAHSFTMDTIYRRFKWRRGHFAWTPTASQRGYTYSVTFTASDGVGTTSQTLYFKVF